MRCPICRYDNSTNEMIELEMKDKPAGQMTYWCPCGCIFDDERVIALAQNPVTDEDIEQARHDVAKKSGEWWKECWDEPGCTEVAGHDGPCNAFGVCF